MTGTNKSVEYVGMYVFHRDFLRCARWFFPFFFFEYFRITFFRIFYSVHRLGVYMSSTWVVLLVFWGVKVYHEVPFRNTFIGK